jgi:hypothetical protein
MSTLEKILGGTEIALALYEAGYIIVRRPSSDPFEPPPGIVPKDRVYQWFHMEHDQFHFGSKTWDVEKKCEGPPRFDRGWAPVEHERHPGIFGPIGHTGHIIKQGLGLFEKPKFEVQREQQEYIEKARAQSDDFFKDKGFIGGARIVEESGGLGQPHKVVERKGPHIEPRETADTPLAERSTTQSPIPADMRPRLARLMAVRDEIYAGLVGDRTVDDDEKILLKNRALNAAVEKVRAEIRKPTISPF